jgi:hypothetical protein
MQHIDIYSDEAASFEADVNLLIGNTLHAALAHLSGTADSELADSKKAIDQGHRLRGPRTPRRRTC